MAKRARVKGKGVDIFFSETEEVDEVKEQTAPNEVEEALRCENERLRTEIEVFQKRVELLEQEIEPLRKQNQEMQRRIETYADAVAKLLFETAAR